MRPSLRRTVLLVLVMVSSCAEPSDLLVSPALVRCEAPSDLSPPTALRLVTYNIRSAQSSSLTEIAEVLHGFDADVIALQEVDHLTDRSDGLDQAGVLAEQLGMHSAFAASRTEGSGDYGVALLSRYPFSEVKRLPLDDGEGSFEPRVALVGELCIGGAPLTVVSLHADVYPWSAAQQVDGLARQLKDRAFGEGHAGPLLVAGDLNAEPEDPGPQALLSLGLIDLGATFPPAPTFSDRRIDYVFASPALAEALVELEAPDVQASDHRPLVVEVGWRAHAEANRVEFGAADE